MELEFVTIRQAAQLLHRHPSTIRRYFDKGLRRKKVEGKTLIAVDDLKTWIEGYDRVCFQADRFLRKCLHDWTKMQLCDIETAKGGKDKLAKNKPTCFNYGFGRVYVRTYTSGRSSWTISYYDEDGKRIQKAVPQAHTRKEAALVLRQEVEKAFDRKNGIERRREKIGFTAFAEVFLQDYAMIEKKSWKTDAVRLRTLNEFFKDTELREISPLMIQKFRAWRLREGNAKSTTNRYLALLKRMFTVAIEESYAEENPVKKVKLFSENDTLKERILSSGEEKTLLEKSADYLKPIIITALNTGMRKAEILNLQWNQIDLKARRIRVENTKSGKVRFIPVNEALFRELTTLRMVSDKSPLVFFNPVTGKAYVDVKKGFKAACRRAGIEGLRFHDLRHTFASRLIEFGATFLRFRCFWDTVRSQSPKDTSIRTMTEKGQPWSFWAVLLVRNFVTWL